MKIKKDKGMPLITSETPNINSKISWLETKISAQSHICTEITIMYIIKNKEFRARKPIIYKEACSSFIISNFTK